MARSFGAWNGVGPGRPYELGLLGLGAGLRVIPGIPPSPPGLLPVLSFSGEFSLFQLSVLTREQSEKSLDAAFQLKAGGPADWTACREPITQLLRDLMSLFRGVISTILAEEAARTGGTSGPVSAKLHAAAMEAVAPLVRYVDGDDKALPAFRTALEKFLLLSRGGETGAAAPGLIRPHSVNPPFISAIVLHLRDHEVEVLFAREPTAVKPGSVADYAEAIVAYDKDPHDKMWWDSSSVGRVLVRELLRRSEFNLVERLLKNPVYSGHRGLFLLGRAVVEELDPRSAESVYPIVAALLDAQSPLNDHWKGTLRLRLGLPN